MAYFTKNVPASVFANPTSIHNPNAKFSKQNILLRVAARLHSPPQPPEARRWCTLNMAISRKMLEYIT